MSEDDKESHWSHGYVSWAQLLGSMAALSFALGSAFVTLLITQETRMTKFEERQQGVLVKNLSQDTELRERTTRRDEQIKELRDEIIKRFDVVQLNQQNMQRDIDLVRLQMVTGDLRKQVQK